MKRLFGGILLGVGILIAGASGLCTIYGLAMSFTEPSSMLSMVPMVLIFGGIPLGIGVAILFGGRALLRSAREDDARASRVVQTPTTREEK